MKPRIEYDPHGETGNIFWIMAELRKTMRKERRINEFNEIWERVQKCKSYEAALRVIGEVAELVEEGK